MLGLTALAARLPRAGADSPPFPSMFTAYGRVELEGQNILPEQQPVIALIEGRPCGTGNTRRVDGPDIPVTDRGKTVYVVDISADGTRSGERPGCGRPGRQVTLYFPVQHRFAVERPIFGQGGARTDVTLAGQLEFRRPATMIAADGVP